MSDIGICLKAMGLALLLSLLPSANAAETATRGSITGGVAHEAPGWFKESFLDIADDVDDATDAGKHVLLFFQLNGCPYCDRMLEESFEAEPMSAYIQQHFDTIAINVRGDRDIAFNDEISVTEKELSEILKVAATPAILFLDEDNKTGGGRRSVISPWRLHACTDRDPHASCDISVHEVDGRERLTIEF